MSVFKPNARTMDLPTLGPVCLLLGYEEADDGRDWRVELHFYHQELAPSQMALPYATDEKAMAVINSITPEEAEAVLRRYLEPLFGPLEDI